MSTKTTVISLAPITEDTRAQWKKDDLERAYGTDDEDQALEKFIAMYGDISHLKNGRESARELMYVFARSTSLSA